MMPCTKRLVSSNQVDDSCVWNSLVSTIPYCKPFTTRTAFKLSQPLENMLPVIAIRMRTSWRAYENLPIPKDWYSGCNALDCPTPPTNPSPEASSPSTRGTSPGRQQRPREVEAGALENER